MMSWFREQRKDPTRVRYMHQGWTRRQHSRPNLRCIRSLSGVAVCIVVYVCQHDRRLAGHGFGTCALMPAPPSAPLARTPSVSLDRWPLCASTVTIMPEIVEAPLDKYLHKYDEHYKRVVPDFELQYRTLEQQYLYEGQFSLFVHELTDDGAVVQDVVTGIFGFLPDSEFGAHGEPVVGSIVEHAMCAGMDNSLVTSPDPSILRLQTGTVWEWDEDAGEGYILPSEGQDAVRMLRVFRRDIDWHDSYRLFVGQFVQVETALPHEVPIKPNDERHAPFALRVRSPEVIFSLRHAGVAGQTLSYSTRNAPNSSINSLHAREWSRPAPIAPDSGRPRTQHVTAKKVAHPALARFAEKMPAGLAESPSWLWQEKLSYIKDVEMPILPMKVQRPLPRRLCTRILTHEVAAEHGDLWKEPALFKGTKDWNKQLPPSRYQTEKMSVEYKEERDKQRYEQNRRSKLRAASVQKPDYEPPMSLRR